MSSGDLTKGSPRLGGSFPSRTATKWLGCQSSARDSASSVRALRRRCVVLFWISLTVCFARRERSMTSPWLRPSSAMRSLIAVATAAQSPVTHSSALHVVAESSADIIPTGDFPAVWRFGMISSQITPRIRLPSAERPTTVTLRPSQAKIRPMSEPGDSDVEARLSVVEREVAQLRAQLTDTRADVTVARTDSAAARVLASGADHDVTEVRAELRAHTQALNALRETQLDHHAEIQALTAETREGFATLRTGQEQITALLERITDTGAN